MRRGSRTLTLLYAFMMSTGALLCAGGLMACSQPSDQPSECPPDLSDYAKDSWAEPDRPPPPAEGLSLSGRGRKLRVELPPKANAGERANTIWLSEAEDLQMILELGLGEMEPASQDVVGVLLIDGLQRLSRVDGVAKETMRRSLAPGESVELQISISAADISMGAHTMHVLFWERTGRSFIAAPFVVLKQSAQFSALSTPNSISKEPRGKTTPGAHVRRTGAPRGLRGFNPDAFEDDGSLPLTFTISGLGYRSCPELSYRSRVVGFLDGEQIMLNDLGVRPLFEFEADEWGHFSIVLDDLPHDGATHTVRFWLIGGDGRFLEAPLGQSSPWFYFPTHLGWLAWE